MKNRTMALCLAILLVLIPAISLAEQVDAATSATYDQEDRLIFSINLDSLSAENTSGEGWLFDAETGILRLTSPNWDYTLTGGENKRVSVQVDVPINTLMLVDATLYAPDGCSDAHDVCNGKPGLAYTPESSPMAVFLVGSSIILGGNGAAVDGQPGGVGGAGMRGLFAISGEGKLSVHGGSGGKSSGNAPAGMAAAGVNGYLAQLSGQVTITGGDSAANSSAPGLDGRIDMYGGTLICIGGDGSTSQDSNLGGDGIRGSVIVYGGRLVATGGDGKNGSGKGGDGIATYGDLYVYEGEVFATGGKGATGGNGVVLKPEGSQIYQQPAGRITYVPGEGFTTAGEPLVPAGAHQVVTK